MKELLAFTRITGDLVKAIRNCRQPAIAAVDGICAGAGAILAMASDIKMWFPHLRSNSFFVKSVSYVIIGASEDQKLIIASQTLKEKTEYFARNIF